METSNKSLSIEDVNNLSENGTVAVKQYANSYKEHQVRQAHLSDIIYLNIHESLSDFASQEIERSHESNQVITWDKFVNNIDSFYEILQVDGNNRITDENHYLYNLIEVEAIDQVEGTLHLASITEHYTMNDLITIINDSIFEPITTSKGIEPHTYITNIYI